MWNRLTHQTFIDRVKAINVDIEVFGEYVNNVTKVKCLCKKDGYIWDAIPKKLMSGHGCPKCGGKLKKTHNEFVEEIKSKNENIEILEEYINNKTRIKCRCKIHDYVWKALPATLPKVKGCPICSKESTKKTKTRTHAEFLEALKAINPNIIALSEYVDCKTTIKCKCKKDGFIWETKPDYLLSGRGCHKCANMVKRTHEQFVREMSVQHPNIEIIGEFKKVSEKIMCKCRTDGHEWNALPLNLIRGCGCPYCNGNHKKTHKQFAEQMSTINKDVELIGKYKTAQTNIKCKCNKCGEIWTANPSNLLSGKGCPKCNASKGEKNINQYLKTNNYSFKTQYTLKKCRDAKTLPFDFAVFNANDLFCLIEYQGIQHYEPIEWFGGVEGFKSQQKRDKIKKDYCKTNNIPLIEIPYWEKDIEQFLTIELNKINNKRAD